MTQTFNQLHNIMGGNIDNQLPQSNLVSQIGQLNSLNFNPQGSMNLNGMNTGHNQTAQNMQVSQ